MLETSFYQSVMDETSRLFSTEDAENEKGDLSAPQATSPMVSSTQHFGPAPKRQARRRKVKKMVPLFNGNLVVDVPIPANMVLPKAGEDETMSMR